MHVKYTQRIVDAKARIIKPALADAMDDHITQFRRNPYHIMAAMLVPAISRVSMRTGFTQSGLDHARIACLLELHHLQHNEYPKTLAELKIALPHDPMSGKAYGYQRSPDQRYRLHSIGWDQKENGAQPAFQTGSDTLKHEAGDWVWQYNPIPLPSELKKPEKPDNPDQ